MANGANPSQEELSPSGGRRRAFWSLVGSLIHRSQELVQWFALPREGATGPRNRARHCTWAITTPMIMLLLMMMMMMIDWTYDGIAIAIDRVDHRSWRSTSRGLVQADARRAVDRSRRKVTRSLGDDEHRREYHPESVDLWITQFSLVTVVVQRFA